MRRFILITGLLLLRTTSGVFSQDSTATEPFLHIQGYVKDLQGLYFSPLLPSSVSSNLLHNRINTRLHFAPALDMKIEIRNRMFWGDQLRLFQDFGEFIDQYNGLIPLSVLWINEPSLVAHTVVDRLMLGYADSRWDIRIGRQRINWGLNTIWNPNDIFNAYNFLDFDYEERPGNDAVRIQRVITLTSSVELAWKPGKEKEETTAALLYKFNTSRYDVQVLAGVYETDWVLGSGWAGHIAEAGFKGEVSYFHPRQNAPDTQGTLSLSVMADQTLPRDWYVSASFLYIRDPADTPGGNALFPVQNLSARQLFPYRYSWYAGVMKSFSPITSFSMSVIYSPTRKSLILFPTLTWNAAPDWDVNLTLQSFFDDSGGVYRNQGHAGYLRVKWSY